MLLQTCPEYRLASKVDENADDKYEGVLTTRESCRIIPKLKIMKMFKAKTTKIRQRSDYVQEWFVCIIINAFKVINKSLTLAVCCKR